jgi:REP element-mobilizing transposase RayT
VPNPLRILSVDATVHAGSRGSNRGRICWDDHDYASLVGEIARAARREDWRVLAWCVMPNHYHLVLRMTRGGFSPGFQQINGNHSRRTNRRYGREAHLWKNRPWHETVETFSHLVGAIESVLRNPIDGDLCERAHDWPYSSYRATIGLEEAPTWLAVDEVLSLYGMTVGEARRRLADRVHKGLVPASDAGLRSG